MHRPIHNTAPPIESLERRRLLSASPQLIGPEILISGNGQPIYSGDVNPASTDGTDIGQAQTGATLTQSFTISNTGDEPLDLTGFPTVPIVGSGQEQFQVIASPASIIAPGSDTTFQVQYAPTQAGVFQALINISNDSINAPNYGFLIQGESPASNASTITISGNGLNINSGDTNPAASDGTDFGNVQPGNLVYNSFTITNNGDSTLDLTGESPIIIFGSGASAFRVLSTGLSSIAPGQSSTFQIAFAPNATGNYAAIVNVFNDSTNASTYGFIIQGQSQSFSSAIINVTANGQEINSGSLSTTPLNNTDFGNVSPGQSFYESFTITNSGSSPLQLQNNSPIDIVGSGASSFQLLSAGLTTINPGTSSTFQIAFNPSVAGTYDAIVNIFNDSSNAPLYGFLIQGESQLSAGASFINVLGNTVAVESGSLDPTNFNGTDFGDVNPTASVIESFTITNFGQSNLDLLGTTPITIFGSGASAFRLLSTGLTTIVPGGNSTFQIEFTPPTYGTFDAIVNIANDSPNAPIYGFVIQGESHA